MPDISIIIVSWNACDDLRNCLRSIDETAADLALETIVVDNASSDGSPEMVAAEFPHVRLIATGENLGFARGNNRGIAASTGRCLALINSDVILLPDCLARCLAHMDAHGDIGLLGPRVVYADGSFQPSCRRLPALGERLGQALFLHRLFPGSALFPEPHMSEAEHAAVGDVPALVGCFWFARREAVDQVGGLDEQFFMYGEDQDWSRRFHDGRWRVVHYPEARAIHIGGASSRRNPVRFQIEMMRSGLLYFEKHNGRAARWAFRAIMALHYGLRAVGRTAALAIPSRRREAAEKLRADWACLRWALGLDGGK